MTKNNLDDTLKIPGNRATYDRLKTMLEAGSATAFVGAGASYPLYPLWNQLMVKLVDRAVELGLAERDAQGWLEEADSNPHEIASHIHSCLGESYYDLLVSLFQERIGDDGQDHTRAHAALMRANFKAYLTTNYDPGLLNARHHLYPRLQHISPIAWDNTYQIDLWSRRLLKSTKPVLYAHGHVEQPTNIILDRESYREAYHDTRYREFFENLWKQEQLVFIGFSFKDVVLRQIANEMGWKTTGGIGPMHIVITGVPEPPPDLKLQRELLRSSFRADALFYRVKNTSSNGEDHSELQILLDSLAPEVPTTSKSVTVPGLKPAITIPTRFVHKTTEDKSFTGRDVIIERLNRWAADPKVRLIAITGIGGLGKTALVGTWLSDWKAARRCDGIFFWSFYEERQTERLFEELLAFARDRLGWKAIDDSADQRAQALNLLESLSLVIALDGLEVVQDPAPDTYGKLLDNQLSDFLHSHCDRSGPDASLLVLSSRYPFPDLTVHFGDHGKPLDLDRLDPAEGARLLAALGIRGEECDRVEISRMLFGHPLALRLFARVVPQSDARTNPLQLWQSIFGDSHLVADDPLKGKLDRLLTFYERDLSKAHRQVLGLIALIRFPVNESILAPLWKELFQEPDGENSLRTVLLDLRKEYLLTANRDQGGYWSYACHPILRDHFVRQLFESPNLARQAAGLLAGSPGDSSDEVPRVSRAIEVLVQAGELIAADDLYTGRLEDGARLLNIPAPKLGMVVSSRFVLDDARCLATREQLHPGRVGFYLNWYAVFAACAGEPQIALSCCPQGAVRDEKWNEDSNLSMGLENRGQTEVSLGQLTKAASHFTQALEIATRSGNDQRRRNILAWRGYSASLLGEVGSAENDFALANVIENQLDHTARLALTQPLPTSSLANAVENQLDHTTDLYSLRGVLWAEHLIRIGEKERARRLTEANLEICSRNDNHWNADIARCEWILGWLDTLAGMYDEAAERLTRAKAFFLEGHMIWDLGRLLLIESSCHLRQGRFDLAIKQCEQALHDATPRNYGLIKADALNVRASAVLAQSKLSAVNARDDAEMALGIAESCQYVWGERDALGVLGIAHHALGNDGEAMRYQESATNLNRRITLPFSS